MATRDARPPSFISQQVEEARYFFLAPASRRAALQVVCGGVERARADYRIERAGLRYCAVEFVAAGKGRLRLNGRDQALGPGMLFAYGPRVGHVIETDPRDRLLKYFVDFAGPAGRRLLRAGPLRGWNAIQAGDLAETRGLFEMLLRYGQSGGARAGAICAVLLEALLLQIAESAVVPAVAQSAAYQTYLRARTVLEQQAVRLQTLRDLAGAVHVEEAYLCRLFRRFDRQSPYQALLAAKLRHGAALLREPGALVKNVALAAGFTDPYHFSRLFKRHYGLAPQPYAAQRPA